MDTEPLTYISIAFSSISAIAAAGSAFAAFWTIKKNTENLHSERASESEARENERLLEHAKTTLERAFIALRGKSDKATVAPKSRLNWLTSARLIEEYKVTKSRISSDVILRECESHEEHWRHQFYLLLDPISQGNEGFKYYDRVSPQELGVSPTSAIVVMAFATWPDSKIDDLKKYKSAQDAVDALGVDEKWSSLRTHLRDKGVRLTD